MLKENTRKLHIDILRLIAVYMVLFNHTRTYGYMLFTVSRSSGLYYFYLLNSVFIKAGVPLFLMISGALLLNRNESFRYILIHRFLKYLVVLFFASLCTYLVSNRFGEYYPELSVRYFLRSFYTNSVATAYWYMYMYLGFILMLPLLRRMAQSMSNRDFRYMFIVYIIIKAWPILDYLLWQGQMYHSSHMSVFFAADYMIYPLAGYFLEHRLPESALSRRNLIILALLSMVTLTISCAMTQYHCVTINEWDESSCQNFMPLLTIVPACTLYIYAKKYFTWHKNILPITARILSQLGGVTFGIYLFERIWRHATQRVLYFLLPVLPPLLSCWIWIFCACMLGGIITFVLKRIPVIKTFL